MTTAPPIAPKRRNRMRVWIKAMWSRLFGEDSAPRRSHRELVRARANRRIADKLAGLVVLMSMLVACQAPWQSAENPATAPVYNGIGINAARGAEVWIDGASPDQSGNVAARGEASQEARQVTQIDPAAVAKGLAEVAEIVVPAGKAAAMLARAEDALNSGDVRKADILGRAARGLAEKEAADAEKAKNAPPGATGAPSAAPVVPSDANPAPAPGTP